MLFEYRVRLWLVEYGSIIFYLILWNNLWFLYWVVFVYGWLYKYIYIYPLLPHIHTTAYSLLKRNIPYNKYSKYNKYSVCVGVSVIVCHCDSVCVYHFVYHFVCPYACLCSYSCSVFVFVVEFYENLQILPLGNVRLFRIIRRNDVPF